MPYTHEQQTSLLERINSPRYLYPEFRALIMDLVRAIDQQRMPFFTYETYRTPQRQKKLISLGFSKLKNSYSSPHVHGLAVDFLIPEQYITTDNKYELVDSLVGGVNAGSEVGYGPLMYNIGVNVIGTSTTKARTIIENEQILNWWKALGTLIERQFPDLVWGGNKDRGPGQHIGSDPCHVEFRNARKLMKQKSAIDILKETGALGLL